MSTRYERRTIELDAASNEAPVVYLVQWSSVKLGRVKPPQTFKSLSQAFLKGRKYAAEWLRDSEDLDYRHTIHEDGDKTGLRQLCETEVNDFGESIFICEDFAGDEIGRFTITECEVQ